MSSLVTQAKKRLAAARARLAEAKRNERIATGEHRAAARAEVAEAEADLQDAEASLDNMSRDLIDESRIDDNAEQVIKALEPKLEGNPHAAALHAALQALAALRAIPPSAPSGERAGLVEEPLRRCIGRLLDLVARATPPTPAKARAAASWGDATLRLPDELDLAPSAPTSARREDRYPIRGLSVLFRGRRGELYGTLYLPRA